MKIATYLSAVIVAWVSSSSAFAQVKRGEVNGDGTLNLSDSIASLDFLFIGGRAPVCLDAADANDDGRFDISDPVFTLAFLFLGGPAPPATPPDCGSKCGAPPFETPLYTRPVDDGIALASLLEGAGYGASSNSDWADIASGNFCGGPEKEIVLVKNKRTNFSILRGPTPYPVSGGDLDSDPAHPWRAVAAGNLDADSFDEIVAVRQVSAANLADIVAIKVDPSECSVVDVVASATIGTRSNSDWIDAAIGNFDGKGNQVAVLKSEHINFFLLKRSGSTFDVTFSSDLDSDASYPIKGIAAGDLDGDGIDELVAARHVSDGKVLTVIVYKWSQSIFVPVAGSAFGSNGNSDWSGITIGDFNDDGHAAIALVKNDHSNFAVLDLPPTGETLREIATSDLDSVSGQEWRGVTATDWLGGDEGAHELIAVRAAEDPYRADLFVYGNPFHRVMRDSGIEGCLAQYDQQRGVSPAELIASLAETHTNTMNWALVESGDYPALVEFLEASTNTCVDGRQLRVSVTLLPGPAASAGNCSLPFDSPITRWNELDYFDPGNGDPLAFCKDTLGWASLIGRLARDYPQLTSLGIDDFTHFVGDYSGEVIAELQSRMRQQAPWLTFVGTAYYDDLDDIPPDLTRTVDTMRYYFRNEKAGICLAGSCGERSVDNAPGEIAEAKALLPPGRKLQVGTYWGTLFSVSPPESPSGRYDYDLVRLIRNLPDIGGVTAYPMQVKTANFVPCDEFNFLAVVDENRFCALQRAFGAEVLLVSDTDLTSLSGAPLASGNPFAYVFPSHDVQNVIYRANDGHAHELWRTSSAIGHSDLTSLSGAPGVVGDPMAYVFAAQDIQNVVYRGTDNHVHGLYWSFGAVGHDNLTALAGAPGADGSPYGYVFDAIGFQNVLYRGSDGHLHGLYWSTGDVGNDDLTALSGASGPAGAPFGYIFGPGGVQVALYRGNDGHLHELYWSTGAVGHDDLTSLSGAPAPAGNAKAYIATTYGTQNAVYRGTDNHVHGLYWSFGAVGHDDLTHVSSAREPAGDPAGYFVEADGRHHVVYRSGEGHIRHLSWTVGVVTHDDLTVLSGAPEASSEPAAYLAADGKTQHVIYRSSDGHLHDLIFSG
jgi:hypothetical protein